jgi:hypothetical protein
MLIENQYHPCLICGKLGIEKRSETLPDGAVLVKVFHDGGKFCAFPEYKSVESFLHRDDLSKSKPIAECPVCQKPGTIRPFRAYKSRKKFNYRFYVAHENVQGYWGKKTKIRRLRRCYIKTDDQINVIKKELGIIV